MLLLYFELVKIHQPAVSWSSEPSFSGLNNSEDSSGHGKPSSQRSNLAIKHFTVERRIELKRKRKKKRKKKEGKKNPPTPILLNINASPAWRSTNHPSSPFNL
jgi:hypothetical protein